MSLYQPGLTLKALLENPELLTMPPNEGYMKAEKCSDDVEKFYGRAAFLGPNIWERTLPPNLDDLNFDSLEKLDFESILDIFSGYQPDPKVEVRPEMVNPMNEGSVRTQACNRMEASSLMARHCTREEDTDSVFLSNGTEQKDGSGVRVISPRERRSVSSSAMRPDSSPAAPSANNFIEDLMSASGTERGDDSSSFDPRKRSFTEEELRVLPVLKKSKKIFVPDDMKDDKYWSRRIKNNTAAKISREARRLKENQITMRTAFLEKENLALREELDKMHEENEALRGQLTHYEV